MSIAGIESTTFLRFYRHLQFYKHIPFVVIKDGQLNHNFTYIVSDYLISIFIYVTE